jgi:hypothetical protein
LNPKLPCVAPDGSPRMVRGEQPVYQERPVSMRFKYFATW